jgi:hypothetical protein
MWGAGLTWTLVQAPDPPQGRAQLAKQRIPEAQEGAVVVARPCLLTVATFPNPPPRRRPSRPRR